MTYWACLDVAHRREFGTVAGVRVGVRVTEAITGCQSW